jgi:DNA-binding NarL/FixJ family response regulator
VTIRVLIADDQALLRAGFCRLIESENDMSVVAEAANGQQAIDSVRACAPDVALLDIRMPVMDGIEATRHIVASADTRVVILTLFDLDEYVYGAIKAGASGFLLKDSPPDQLLAAIRAARAGDALIAPSVTRRLLNEFADQRRPPSPGALAILTDREREVLIHMATGLNNSEIAAVLFLGEATIKTHVSNIFAKLHARDRVQAVVWAYENGLAQPRRTTD